MPEKKRLPKKQIKKDIKPKNAPPEHYFILVTGIPLKNLKELANSLETMNDWAFSHHVNDSRNDFSNWISEILDEKELAEEIRELRNVKEMEMKLLKHLVMKYL